MIVSKRAYGYSAYKKMNLYKLNLEALSSYWALKS